MEARQTLRGSAVPKGLMVVLAICAAVALAAVGTAITKDIAGSKATVRSTVQAAPGTVLRQDNPVQPALSSAQAAKHDGRKGGTQSIEGSDSGSAESPSWDARTVREGHGP